jgi:hypothetical protein
MFTKFSSSINYIKFHYKYDDIYDAINLETEARASKITTESGEPMIEEFTLTANEQTFYEKFFKDAIYEIGRIITNLTYGLGNAIFHGEGTPKELGFLIIDHNYYNDNWLIIVDKDVEQLLESYALMQWYQKCGLNDDYTLAAQNYGRLVEQLTDDIYELRRPDISSTTPVPSTSYPKTEVIEHLNIIANQEMNVSHTMGSKTYFVHAIKSDGVSIPGFDNIISMREDNYIVFRSMIGYTDVRLLLVGVTDDVPGDTTQVKIIPNIDITPNVLTTIDHSFGNSNYIVEAKNANGLSIPNFDSLISERNANDFKFTSVTEYSGVTIMLTGVI